MRTSRYFAKKKNGYNAKVKMSTKVDNFTDPTAFEKREEEPVRNI